MPWQQPHDKEFERPENLESILMELKNQLDVINSDISSAILERDTLVSGNHHILKEKKDELDFKIKEQDDLRQKHSESLTAANDHIASLRQQQEVHNFDVDDHNSKKIKFVEEVKKAAASLDEREELVKQSEAILNNRKIQIEQLEVEAAALMKSAKMAQDNAEKSLAYSNNKAASLEENILKSENMLEEIESSKQSVNVINEQNKAILREAVAEKAEAQKALNDNLTILKQIESEKEKNMSILIDAKKETQKNKERYAILQKLDIETNQKLAELKDLQEKLSK